MCHPSTTNYTMDTVCLKCGDRGFTETLVSCNTCQACALHRYCLDGPVIFLDEVTWFCEDCEAKLGEPSFLDQSIPVSSESGDSISLANDAINARKKLRNCINGVKKSNQQAHKMIEEKQTKRKVSNQQLQKMAEEEKQKTRRVSNQQQQKMTEEEKQKKRNVSNHQQQKITEEEKQKKRKVSNQQQQKMTEEEKQKKMQVSTQQQQKMTEDKKQKKRDVSNQQQQKMTEDEKQKKRKVSSQQQQKMIEEENQMKRKVDPGLVTKTDSHSLPQLEHTQCSNFSEERSKLKNECGQLPTDAANSNVRSESVQDSPVATSDGLNCVELDHDIYAQPIANPIWRGSFNFCNGTVGIVNGLLAHMSSLACYKVQKETTLLPEVLCADLLPRSVVWPKSFEDGGPTDQSIALYFFPESERDEKAFDKLVDDIIQLELAIRVVTENAELLIFSSTALPMKDRRFQAKYYLWGVFRRKQTSHKTNDATCREDTGVDQPLTRDNVSLSNTLSNSGSHDSDA